MQHCARLLNKLSLFHFIYNTYSFCPISLAISFRIIHLSPGCWWIKIRNQYFHILKKEPLISQPRISAHFFHVAKMKFSFSTLSPPAKEGESEAFLASAGKDEFQKLSPPPRESERIRLQSLSGWGGHTLPTSDERRCQMSGSPSF